MNSWVHRAALISVFKARLGPMLFPFPAAQPLSSLLSLNARNAVVGKDIETCDHRLSNPCEYLFLSLSLLDYGLLDYGAPFGLTFSLVFIAVRRQQTHGQSL